MHSHACKDATRLQVCEPASDLSFRLPAKHARHKHRDTERLSRFHLERCEGVERRHGSCLANYHSLCLCLASTERLPLHVTEMDRRVSSTQTYSPFHASKIANNRKWQRVQRGGYLQLVTRTHVDKNPYPSYTKQPTYLSLGPRLQHRKCIAGHLGMYVRPFLEPNRSATNRTMAHGSVLHRVWSTNYWFCRHLVQQTRNRDTRVTQGVARATTCHSMLAKRVRVGPVIFYPIRSLLFDLWDYPMYILLDTSLWCALGSLFPVSRW